jgi:hypothetical protein
VAAGISPTTMVFRFNRKIDHVSAAMKENYDIMYNGKKLKIASILVKDSLIYLKLQNLIVPGRNDSILFKLGNIKDADGNIVNKRKSLELYQYRELFVQEYNKSLPLKDSCYIQYLPLEQNCVYAFPGKDKYWMNTPEKIK